jgi:hypothetical protein
MGSNKTHRSTSAANGATAVTKLRPPRVAKAKLELRVAKLEQAFARLQAERDEVGGPRQPWWEIISGTFANDPAFEEAMRLGREWRESFRPKTRKRRAKSAHGHS